MGPMIPKEIKYNLHYAEVLWSKVYIIGPDHVTKVAAMPIYGEKPLKSSSPEL